ncbi:toxin VasX [Paracoccus sp. S1E-3]|uniref:toxin VasX n=1 Tax=Paracoccus sp. S1E-3 TaxID=2756130 RepID=UPI0015EE60A8|nr:toxin VasX [Paracoccus sp. S1E-3]MBA4491335.1 hypothetical protein [Paracoccus sp. S1E-3]
MTYGDFSPSNDPEDPAFHCTPDRIPIFPVRFSLLPYENLRAPQKPTAIGTPGNYILRTLRRGFVYIYIEQPEERASSTSSDGLWYVFRYSTGSEDANSDVTPANAQVDDRGSGQFVKYEWTNPYGDGEWTYSNETSRDCWVPKWASKIWVAFSEYRWPPAFFRKGHDAGFRAQLMAPVNLRGTNDWAAFAGDAEKLVEEFKPLGSQPQPLKARLGLSQTGFRGGASWNPAITPRNEKCVALVAVHDVMGDIEEMSYRLQLLDDHQKNFTATYAYPLTVGKLCTQLEPNIPKRDGRFERLFNSPALGPDWKTTYRGLYDQQQTMLRFMDDCTAGLCVQMVDQGSQMLGTHLTLAAAEAMSEAKGDDARKAMAAEYYSVMFGRACAAFNLTHVGASVLRRALGNKTVKIPEGAPEIKDKLEKFAAIWGGLKEVAYDQIRKSQYSFQIAFEAVAVQLAHELAGGNQRIANWQDALEAGFRQGPNSRLAFGTVRLSLDEAARFVQGIGGPYSSSRVAGQLVTGEIPEVITRMFVNAGPSADIPYIRTSTTWSLVGGITAERRIAMADLPHNALAVFVSSWALFSTATGYKKAGTMIAQGKFTAFTSSQGFQLAAATASVTEALTNSYKAFGKTSHTASQISAEALETLYNSRVLRGATPLVRMSQPATALGRRLAFGATAVPYVAAIFGTVASIGGIVRGMERDDDAEIWGNAVMLIGGLLMIPGLGWAAAGIGAVILAVGFLISLSSYDALEDIVRFGFWGSSKEYWDRARPTFYDQIEMAKDLPDPYRSHFEEEMARFAELTWAPVIFDPVPGDRKVMVRSNAIREIGVAEIEVKVTHKVPNSRGDFFIPRALPNTKQRIGTSDSMWVTFGEPHPMGLKSIEVEVSLRGPRSGFEHTAKKEFATP